MIRVYISRFINLLLGGKKGQMLCSRVYINHWPQAELVLDAIFGELHCKLCFIWEANNETEISPFTILEDKPMAEKIRCANCLEMAEPENIIVMTKQTDKGEKTFHFCGHACEQDFYINTLRQMERG